MYLDYPSSNTLVGDKIIIDGWLMSTNQSGSFKVLVDDVEIPYTIKRSRREDVVRAIKGYGDSFVNKMPGFKINLDMSKYLDGSHIIFVRVYDNNTGELIEEKKKSIKLDKYDSDMYIDNPNNDYSLDGINLIVDGWLMTEAVDYSLKLFVDEKEVDTKIERHVREDVIGAYSSKYDNNSNLLPGFKISANLDYFKDGKHVVMFEAIDNLTNEVLISKSKTIMLKKYKSKAYVENPSVNQFIKGTKMSVGGWFMSTSLDNYLKFYIDGEEWDMQKGIDYIIDETEKCLISYRDNFPDTKIPEKIYDVLKQLMPLMWW